MATKSSQFQNAICWWSGHKSLSYSVMMGKKRSEKFQRGWKSCLLVFMRVDNSSEIFLLCIIARLESKDGFPSKQICSSWLKMLQYKTFFASKLIQANSSQLALRATRLSLIFSLLNRLTRHCFFFFYRCFLFHVQQTFIRY